MASPPGRVTLPPRRRAPPFQPRFTLTLVYLAGFFVLFAMLMILPELLRVLGGVPPGPEQQEIAREVAREASRGRLLPAFLLALAVVAVGSWWQILPGTKRP